MLVKFTNSWLIPPTNGEIRQLSDAYARTCERDPLAKPPGCQCRSTSQDPMKITTKSDLDSILASGPYAWPGGYPIYFIASDGEALSFETVQQERDRIMDSLDEHSNDGWRVVAADINWEDPDLYCAHSGKRIESAYAEA